MHYVITRFAYKIILADFNLPVSTPTAKPAKYNSPSNFPAIRYISQPWRKFGSGLGTRLGERVVKKGELYVNDVRWTSYELRAWQWGYR